MRLINTETLQLVDGCSPAGSPYAILSHRWGDNELSLQDYERDLKQGSLGHRKIIKCCELARERGLPYAWIDTCCIDKTNPMELTESIQSMFQWYESARVCFAFLDKMIGEDSNGELLQEELKSCEWFTRGWTLQELLAPTSMELYDANHRFIGDLRTLAPLVATVTCIRQDYLTKITSIRRACVATRMSWVSQRHTTRPEDIAYCLLGIFDVHMPLFYGEGGNKAFLRLQEHIIARSDDESIFAWEPVYQQGLVSTSNPSPRRRGILAEHPSEFRNGASLRRSVPELSLAPVRPPFNFTNRGLEISVFTWFDPHYELETKLVLACERQETSAHHGDEALMKSVTVHLRRNEIAQGLLWYRVEGPSPEHPKWRKMRVLADRARDLLAGYTKVCVARSSADLASYAEDVYVHEVAPASILDSLVFIPNAHLLNTAWSLNLAVLLAVQAAFRQSEPKATHSGLWSLVIWCSLLYGYRLCQQSRLFLDIILALALLLLSLHGGVSWLEWVVIFPLFGCLAGGGPVVVQRAMHRVYLLISPLDNR